MVAERDEREIEPLIIAAHEYPIRKNLIKSKNDKIIISTKKCVEIGSKVLSIC